MINPGKTLTVFAVLIIVILVSSTSIGFFLYHQERNTRKALQNDMQAAKELESKLQNDLAQTRKQIALLEDKNKEADEKINNLLDEMELNDGLRDELKKENENYKTQLDAATKIKEKAKADMEEHSKKVADLERMINEEKEKNKTLAAQVETYKAQQAQVMAPPPSSEVAPVDKVELDKIIVNPDQSTVKGRVVSIDKDSEFIICNLGFKQGVKSGDILSVYRGEEYLGDVKATRVQDQLSAADIIPPFSSRRVRKNDIVMLKPQ